MTLKSWTVSQTDTWKRQGRTFTTHCVYSPMIFIVSAVWYLLVMLVLLPWLALDWLPKRRAPSRSTSPSPQRRKHETPARKLPILLHEKGGFFAIQPDGSKVEIDPLLFSEHFRQCSSALAAAMVYEKTKIAVDENR